MKELEENKLPFREVYGVSVDVPAIIIFGVVINK